LKVENADFEFLSVQNSVFSWPWTFAKIQNLLS